MRRRPSNWPLKESRAIAGVGGSEEGDVQWRAIKASDKYEPLIKSLPPHWFRARSLRKHYSVTNTTDSDGELTVHYLILNFSIKNTAQYIKGSILKICVKIQFPLKLHQYYTKIIIHFCFPIPFIHMIVVNSYLPLIYSESLNIKWD